MLDRLLRLCGELVFCLLRCLLPCIDSFGKSGFLILGD